MFERRPDSEARKETPKMEFANRGKKRGKKGRKHGRM
jgi:hypothetical protein